MMKGRFSFNLRETFGSGKPEERGDGDYDYDWSPPPSPYPGLRSPLPPRLEADLKLACAAIVINTIPSDYQDESTSQPSEIMPEHVAIVEPKEPKERKYRERSLSNKFIRNFSMPAQTQPPTQIPGSTSISEVPDFPLPNRQSTSIDRSRYGHKADMALSAIFGLASRSSNNSLRQTVSKRKSETLSVPDQAGARSSTGRPTSKSFSVVTNLPFFASSHRPKTIRRTVSDDNAAAPAPADEDSENPWDRPRPLSGVAPKRAKHASYHATTQVDPELEVVKAAVRGRQRGSWYRMLWGGEKSKSMDFKERAQLEQRSKTIQEQREKTLQELRGKVDTESEEKEIQPPLEPREEVEEPRPLLEVPAQPDFKRRSRAATHPRGVADQGHLDQLQRSRSASRNGSRSPSMHSRRSSASSGVIPIRYSRFSWKNVRKSWTSWRDASEDEDGAKRRSVDKRQSNGSLRNRRSTNINRDTQPLPIIDQYHGEEPEIEQILEEIPPVPTTDIEQPTSHSEESLLEKTEDQSSLQPFEQPQQPNPTTDVPPVSEDNITPESARAPSVEDSVTSAIEPVADTTTEPPAKIQPEIATEVKVGAEATIAPVKVVQINSPATSRTKPSPKPIQIRPPSKRSSIIIRNQTDPARAREHRKSVDLMTAVQLAKAAEARKTLELQKHLEALKHVETRTPVASPRKNVEFRKSLDFKKSVEFWKSIEKRSSPDFKKKAEYRRSCSDIRQLQPMTSNEGLQYRNAVLSAQATPRHVPIQAESVPEVEPMPQAVPKPNHVSQPTPTDSVMDDQDPQGSTGTEQKAVDIAPTRTPPNGPLPSPPPGSIDALPMSPSSISSSRKQRPLSWLPPQQDIPDITKLDISKKRISRTDLELQLNGTIGSIPGRLLERERPRSIASSSFKSVDRTDSTEVYNTLQSTKYQYADDITSLGSPPPSPKQSPNRKKRWPFLAGQKKPMTWMDEMEKLGVKDGMLMVDQLNGPPIVRY